MNTFTSSAIFVFTRDRPATLSKTLKSIQDIPYLKYIIDDSIEMENQQWTSELCSIIPGCIYLGKRKFNQFIEQHSIEFPRFDFLLRELGFGDWNLGYARNFALLYAKALHIEKVLFTDDDIEVIDLSLIERLFGETEKYAFVGANILGLVDDSVLGHIASDLGIMNERMLSGGFMAFKVAGINHFFLNNYNEDWIWLFLQLKDKVHLQTGEVFQELTDPLNNYRAKVVFQEYGEIALDGILDLFSRGPYKELVLLSFWERIVSERKEYLNLLSITSEEEKKKRYVEIIEYVKSNSHSLNAIIFKDLFEKYFKDRDIFQEFFESLS